jgi:hypothetical protein
MAGDAHAQYWIGFILQQELLGTPTAERSSFAPQRFEYMRNFLILAVKNGSRSAASELAGAYVATERDVVETAAWLRIAGQRPDGTELLNDYERQGIIVLSEEQRAESLRYATDLAELYNLPLSRGVARVVPDGEASNPVPGDCVSTRSDPYSSAAADLESYRADVERYSFAPGIVSEAELRRRFRDLRTRFVTSLHFGNRSALPMLVALHRTSLTDEDVVAAAAWDRVAAKLNGTSSELDSPNASAADIWAGLPASEDLPRSGLRLTDPKAQQQADNVRRQGVRAGILADQYIMMFELD